MKKGVSHSELSKNTFSRFVVYAKDARQSMLVSLTRVYVKANNCFSIVLTTYSKILTETESQSIGASYCKKCKTMYKIALTINTAEN